MRRKSRCRRNSRLVPNDRPHLAIWPAIHRERREFRRQGRWRRRRRQSKGRASTCRPRAAPVPLAPAPERIAPGWASAASSCLELCAGCGPMSFRSGGLSSFSSPSLPPSMTELPSRETDPAGRFEISQRGTALRALKPPRTNKDESSFCLCSEKPSYRPPDTLSGRGAEHGQFAGILGNFTQERDALAGKDANRATIFS